MTTARFIRYQLVDDGAIVRVVMDRPRTRNAQNRGLLVELGEAFERAEADDQVRVVILSGDGPSFSAGHDLGSAESIAEREPGPGQHPSYTCRGGTRPGLEPKWLQEWHYYFANTWCCDLIVAAEDTVFADVVGTRLGMCGVEYFAHPWEFGPRLAKELLLTGDSLDAQTAAQLHMVSKRLPVRSVGRRDSRPGPADRATVDDDGIADQGLGEPLGRRDGIQQRAGDRVRPAPAQPRAVDVPVRRQDRRRHIGVRSPALEGRSARASENDLANAFQDPVLPIGR
jgi:enoyl-CoA hydratase/carnithine racemase